MRTAIYTIGVLIGAVVIAALLFDEGEVATLDSVDAEGRHLETQVWVVEIDGAPFLRANSPDSDWLSRVRSHPEVELRRGEDTRSWIAEPSSDAALREQVNRAMAEKYGTADRVLGAFYAFEEMVPVRLAPPSEGA